jgi:hypothetical protein
MKVQVGVGLPPMKADASRQFVLAQVCLEASAIIWGKFVIEG